jgi:hypothetical protein
MYIYIYIYVTNRLTAQSKPYSPWRGPHAHLTARCCPSFCHVQVLQSHIVQALRTWHMTCSTWRQYMYTCMHPWSSVFFGSEDIYTGMDICILTFWSGLCWFGTCWRQDCRCCSPRDHCRTHERSLDTSVMSWYACEDHAGCLYIQINFGVDMYCNLALSWTILTLHECTIAAFHWVYNHAWSAYQNTCMQQARIGAYNHICICIYIYIYIITHIHKELVKAVKAPGGTPRSLLFFKDLHHTHTVSKFDYKHTGISEAVKSERSVYV